jgi:hypothetical protein
MSEILPTPFPTTLHPNQKYPKGQIIPWKAATNKKDFKKAVPPDGWERVPDVGRVKLKPKHLYNQTNENIYIMYIRKVA